jgi:hypothetical protein
MAYPYLGLSLPGRRRTLALSMFLLAATAVAACADDGSGKGNGLNAIDAVTDGTGTRQLKGVTTPGNCGGSASNGEDSCLGRADGIYCSTLRDFSAIECKDGTILTGHQCSNAGEKCIGPNGVGSTIQCGADEDLNDDGSPKDPANPDGAGGGGGSPQNFTPHFHAATDELNKYGEECQAEVGLMPAFDCMDFPEIPTLQDGKALTVVDKGGGAMEIQREGRAIAGKFGDEEVALPDGSKQTIKDQWAPRPTCDNPSWASTPCYPGTRVGILKTANAAWAVLCRRQSVQASTNPYFQLIGVIAHNKTSGATCFFDKKTPVTLTKKTFAAPGDPDPKRQKDAVRIWAEPGPSFENCMQCHATGAFIRSPYVRSVALKDEMSDDYFVIGKKFKELWMRDRRGNPDVAEDYPRTLELDDGSCAGCHRLASSSQPRMFANLAVGGPEVDDKSSETRLAKVRNARGVLEPTRWPEGYWMPPSGRRKANLAAWTKEFSAEQASVSLCSNDPTARGCTLAEFAYFK